MTTKPAAKTIRYDRETRDYALYLNDEFVGYASTYTEGQVILDQLAASIPDGTAEDDYSDVGPERSDLLIPPTADILSTVKERIETARLHEDWPGVRQLDRIRQNLLNGARLQWHAGDLLIQSVNNPGQVYSTNGRGCSCPNGQKGKSECWHVATYDLLLEMLDDRAAAADILADAAAERELGRRIAMERAARYAA